MTTRRIALPLSAFRRIKNNPRAGFRALHGGFFVWFTSYRRRALRRCKSFRYLQSINRDRYIIDAINNRERLRKIAFPNVSDQFIFCKNTAGALVFARNDRQFRSRRAIQRKNTLAAIECYAGHRQRKNVRRSFKFAKAPLRLRAGFFTRTGGGLPGSHSQDNATATPEAFAQSRLRLKGRVAATKEEDFFILIPLLKL